MQSFGRTGAFIDCWDYGLERDLVNMCVNLQRKISKLEEPDYLFSLDCKSNGYARFT